MVDISTIWDDQTGTGDWSLDPPSQFLWTDESGNSIVDEKGSAVDAQFYPGAGLVSGADLYTAVLISVFTDATADPDDVIPDGSSDPRGWWAGDIGSKLWLRSRSKATATVPALIQNDLTQALAWLIEDDVVASITVTASYVDAKTVGGTIVFKRRDGARMAVRFSRIWENI